MSKQTILLNRDELDRIYETIAKFPDAKHFDISVESISGLGKVTKLEIYTKVNGILGSFTATITDESNW